MNARRDPSQARDPWRDAPTSELGDQLLPRWFVLTAIAAVVAAIAAVAAALAPTRDDAVPVEARRPPPSAAHTTAVGAVQAGEAEPEPYDSPCQLLQGTRIAGSQADRQLLRQGLAGLCNTALPDAVVADVRAFAQQGGVVRFATFEATGVDSTATRGTPPTVFVNARFARTDPLWIAPLIVHDAVSHNRGRTTAEDVLAARQAELVTCERLLGSRARSRGCADAQAIVDMDDPLAALRAVGFE